MTVVTRMLHDPGSQLMDMLLHALKEGKLCIIDVSQLRGEAALVLSGLILRHIFDRNQEEFTKANPNTIPVIAVIEEAQSVLREGKSATAPFVEWVKEGRKYDLGAVMITQQPGSISKEILSQGDNWFLFHLLSASDLQNVRHANAHFSEDLLSGLLNEPIPGQGVFWSSVSGRPYPIPLRVLSFEWEHKPLDPEYNRSEMTTYAYALLNKFRRQIEDLRRSAEGTRKEQQESPVRYYTVEEEASPINNDANNEVDVLALHKDRAIEVLEQNDEFRSSVSEGDGIPWGIVVGILASALPATIQDRNHFAHRILPEAVSTVLGGAKGIVWDTERRETRSGKIMPFIFKLQQVTS